MMRRPYSNGLDAALAILGGKWKCLILWNLAQRPRRFGELRKGVTGISEKMLIQELKEMVRDGIISRTDFHEVPPRVEYALTEFGMEFADALHPLCDLGAKYMALISDLPAPIA